MKIKHYSAYLILLSALLNMNCHAQKSDPPIYEDRQPAVAGQFYAGDSLNLRSDLEKLFEVAVKKMRDKNPRAIIVPHAGYVFSGEVAASGFMQIDPQSTFDRIFIIGSSHTDYFDGASIWSEGHFITPLGKVAVDTATCNALLEASSVFSNRKDVHKREHSLEVELPFLQYHLEKEFKIVPISIGGNSENTIKKIAAALKPFYNERNLFVISTDFSHYPDYEDAVTNDARTKDAIMTNSLKSFRKVLAENEAENIKGLVTSICGATSVMVLLNLTEDDSSAEFVALQYQNSGDSPHGDSAKVVGYQSLALYSNENAGQASFDLSAKDRKTLLELARKTIISYVTDKKTLDVKPENYSTSLQEHCGAFVTLHKNGKLRGCIGRFNPDEALCQVVRDMAIAAATQDYRFSPVSVKEIEELKIEISVLSPMKKIESIDEIILGTHGIYISQGVKGGTFLPQVATETGWSKEEFLGHCARDKAGLDWDGWKDADIYIYSAVVFGEE